MEDIITGILTLIEYTVMLGLILLIVGIIVEIISFLLVNYGIFIILIIVYISKRNL